MGDTRSRTTGTLLAAACSALLLGCGGQVIVEDEAGDADILDRLRGAPFVVGVQEVGTDLPGYRSFLIDFDQPVDHDDPSGQRFLQRLALLHRDAAAPFVLATTGYYLFGEALTEPAELLDANQLLVEERYFFPSRPYPTDWSFLDIRQAAADHHAVAEALRTIYGGRWISTGVSKGGMASVYHRRFFPGDVDGTVAYVTPNNEGIDDPRYVDFVASLGTAACRARLADAQREVLLRREAMTRRMVEAAAREGTSYELRGPDAALEGIAVSLPFSFWQAEGEAACAGVPGAGASDDELYTFLERVGRPGSSTDQYVLGMEPYRWQALTELGTPGLDESPVADLLTIDPGARDGLPTIDADPVFDPEAMRDIAAWVASEGERILFVYGESDPWTAGAFDLGDAAESYALIQPGGNHRSRILGLAPADRRLALDALSAWSGVTPRLPPGQQR